MKERKIHQINKFEENNCADPDFRKTGKMCQNYESGSLFLNQFFVAFFKAEFIILF